MHRESRGPRRLGVATSDSNPSSPPWRCPGTKEERYLASTYMNEHTHGACGKAAGTPGSVLQMRKPRFRVAKGLAQDHTVRKCQREG